MMNKRLAKLQKELDISDTHNMPSTDIILKNVNNKINVSPEERKIYMKRKYLKITSIALYAHLRLQPHLRLIQSAVKSAKLYHIFKMIMLSK